MYVFVNQLLIKPYGDFDARPFNLDLLTLLYYREKKKRYFKSMELTAHSQFI